MAYHGDTVGSVSVGGIDLFHSMYRPLLFDTLKAEPGDLAAMEALLRDHAGEVAAVIMEPLVQGAAGMLVHPEGYLRGVRELCDRYGVLLILDEVATGFGRTGRMFACEHEDVAPDLLCLAKGITGGYLPLAATLATEEIYEGFLGEFEEFRTFFHGHTYTGNPLACAAALASLDVFSEERTLEALAPKIELLGSLLQPLAGHPAVREVRRVGFMVGIELEEYPLAGTHGSPRDAGGAPPRRDHPAARRRGRADAPAGDLCGRPHAAGVDHRRRDRHGHVGRPRPRGGGLTLVQLEVALARAAHRTEPVVRDVVERRSRRNASVGIPLGGVVDEAARRADPLLCGHGLAQGVGKPSGSSM